MTAQPDPRLRRFREAYATHRAREGRGLPEDELLRLPEPPRGPLAAQWRVRRSTYRCFVARVLRPLAAAQAPRPVTLLDLGAGNGWLSYRVEGMGHRAIALDLRTDRVDGLGAAAGYARHLPRPLARVAAGFEMLPVASGHADLAVFNASLHYALDLGAVLREATLATRSGGRLAILDTPFYPTAAAGDAMVAEKRAAARATFGDLAGDLSDLPFIEYLTPERLADASRGLGLAWRRHRAHYPLAYRLRPVIARLRGGRRPSRFDVWEAAVS